MTTYEKIKALLELNTLRGVAVQEKGTDKWGVAIRMCSHFVWFTPSTKDIDEALNSTTLPFLHTCDEINKYFRSEIVPLPMKPKVLPVCTKVKILDIVKEGGDYNAWPQNKKNIKGGIIETVYNDISGIYYTIGIYTFPSYCVVPDFDEEVCTKEDTRERIILNGKTYVLEE